MFEPKSKQDNDAVSAIAKAKGISRFWIGISRKSKNVGIFVYDSNDLPISYENWAPGEPNDSNGEEECVEIGYLYYPNYKWNDQKCADEISFVCER